MAVMKICRRGHTYSCDNNRKSARGCRRCRNLRRRNSPAYQRVLVRNAVFNAVSHGRMTKEPCLVCGCPDVEAHHEDYSQRFVVLWLCQVHHNDLHQYYEQGITPP